MTADVLHLVQHSASWRDPDHQVARDFDRTLRLGADAVGFTEIYNDIDLLRESAEDFGYQLFFDTRTGKAETVVAVRNRLRILDSGAKLINPADPGVPPHGGHSARYATWVQFEWHDNEVFFGEGHWVTNGEGRSAKRREMSRFLGKMAAEMGEGAALAFVAGDTNENDRRDNDGSEVYEPLERHGLVTIFDEVGAWPATHEGRHDSTIDIVASLEQDRRVRAVRMKIHRDRFTDHHITSAFYRVAAKRKAR